jgi:hypothetical protein
MEVSDAGFLVEELSKNIRWVLQSFGLAALPVRNGVSVMPWISRSSVEGHETTGNRRPKGEVRSNRIVAC